MAHDLLSLLAALARAAPERPALLCVGPQGVIRRSWSELYDRVTWLRGALLDRELASGRRVGAYLYNGFELVETCCAVLVAGADLVGISPRLAGSALARQLHVQPLDAVIYQGALTLRIWELRERLRAGAWLVQVDDGTELPLPGSRDYEQTLRRAAKAAPAQQWAESLPARVDLDAEPAVMLVAGPLAEGGLEAAVLGPLLSGHVLLMAPGARLDAHLVWGLAEEHRARELLVATGRDLAALLDAWAEAAGGPQPYEPGSLQRIIVREPQGADLEQAAGRIGIAVAAGERTG